MNKKMRMLSPILLACLTGLTILAGCGFFPTAQTENAYNGLVSCGTLDGGATDAGAVADMATPRDLTTPADLTPPPDLWSPTCTYHWVRNIGFGRNKIGTQDPIVLKAKYKALYPGSVPTFSDPDRQYEQGLVAMGDPSNPIYPICSGCRNMPDHAYNPRFRFTVDISAKYMPSRRPQDLDMNLLFGYVNFVPSTTLNYVSPHVLLSDRKLVPGRHNYDFTIAGKVVGMRTWLIGNNEDVADSAGWAEFVITFGDIVSTQPCKGFLPGDL